MMDDEYRKPLVTLPPLAEIKAKAFAAWEAGEVPAKALAETAIEAGNMNNAEGFRCKYSSPCIIGSVLTPEQREFLKKEEEDGVPISSLIRRNVVALADPNDARAITDIQEAHDALFQVHTSDPNEVRRRISANVDKLVGLLKP